MARALHGKQGSSGHPWDGSHLIDGLEEVRPLNIRLLPTRHGSLNMGHQGRFGKYGEKKRLERLRHAGIRDAVQVKAKVLTKKEGAFSRNGSHRRVRVRITPAKALDIDFIRRLSGSAFEKYGSYGDVVSQWFQSEMTQTFIGRMERRPVGFAMVGLIKEDNSSGEVCELLAIAVESDQRLKGIGQMLLNAAEQKAVEWRMDRIFLHTARENLQALNLFTRNGFVSWGLKKHFYPAGQDALVMAKKITF